MAHKMSKLAVCTTIYNGVEPFLADWYDSVVRQTCQDYQLWIALDGLSVDHVVEAMGARPEAVWVQIDSGESPATIRQKLLAPVAAACDGAVLVDSDDILHPERVAAAQDGLQRNDLVACALRLVDHHGRDLHKIFEMSPRTTADDVLPRHNIFGLSNTAWRCNLLKQCLPIPSNVELVDWYLATRAWLLEAKLHFDHAIGMDYRQHNSNMTGVCGPFHQDQIARDTQRVLQHYHFVLNSPPEGSSASRLARIKEVVNDVERFAATIVEHSERLHEYKMSLNALNPPPLWWSCVAHPSLRHQWSQ